MGVEGEDFLFSAERRGLVGFWKVFGKGPCTVPDLCQPVNPQKTAAILRAERGREAGGLRRR